jgi:hypothetical protein
MKTNEKIIKWLKTKKTTNKKFGYYVDSESFMFRFPSEYEDNIVSKIHDVIEQIPHMLGYNVWDKVTIYIPLNHPQLDPEKLFALLPALEDAEKSLI